MEIGLGLLLLAGVGVRPTAVVSAALLVVFMAGVASAWARGLSIDCGCFGGGGAAQVGAADYLTELGRDLGFLALAGRLVGVAPAQPGDAGSGLALSGASGILKVTPPSRVTRRTRT